jgi:hypothetical protein
MLLWNIVYDVSANQENHYGLQTVGLTRADVIADVNLLGDNTRTAYKIIRSANKPV